MSIFEAVRRNRLQRRVNEAAAVFDRESDPRGERVARYLFDLLNETDRDGVAARRVRWGPVIDMFRQMGESGEAEPFDVPRADGTPSQSGWEYAHSLMCRLLRVLLWRDAELAGRLVKDHGERILSIARHVIAYSSRIGDALPAGGATPRDPAPSPSLRADLAQIHRSSAAGILEALILDDVDPKRRIGGPLADRAKAVLEEVLVAENHPSAMFSFAGEVWRLYARDPDWTRELLPTLFPEDGAKRGLFLASMTGFLSRGPSREAFADPDIQGLYWRGLGLDREVDIPHRPHRNPDFAGGIAEHFAVACLRHEIFGFGHPLFRALRDRGDPGQLAAFVRKAGKLLVAQSNHRHADARGRLLRFWEWMLATHTDPRPFTEFGMWMTLRHGMFDSVTLARLAKETLRKTGGDLSERFELGVSVGKLAHDAPEDALEISDLFLHGRSADLASHLEFARVPGGWRDAVNFLCENVGTREAARARLGDVRAALSSSVPHAV